MTKRPSTVRQSDIKRAVEGAKSAGMAVVAVEVGPDGRILVIGEGGQVQTPQRNPWDEA